MKKTITLIGIFALFLFSACEIITWTSDDDELLLGSIFEIEGDFTSENNYTLFYEFPSDFVVYDTDVIMVYILWEQVDDSDGESIDVWRALPQTVILDEGLLQYNFDYTYLDVSIFLDGDIDFGTLLPAEKSNQIFRIAVLPAEYANDESVDLNNLNSLLGELDLTSGSISTISL